MQTALLPGRIRGAADGPLTSVGRSEAKRLGQCLADAGGLTCLYLSTSKRTRETADAILKACPATELETPVDDILSWRLGELEGKPITEAQPKIESFLRYLPDTKLPGKSDLTGKTGESFDDFRWRALPYIGQQMEESFNNKKLKLGILTHERVVHLLIAWIKGGMSPFFDVDKTYMSVLQETGHPGSVWALRPEAGRLWSCKTFLPSASNKLTPGVYVIRHTATALNSL